jgi:hypothetical protein
MTGGTIILCYSFYPVVVKPAFKLPTISIVAAAAVYRYKPMQGVSRRSMTTVTTCYYILRQQVMLKAGN